MGIFDTARFFFSRTTEQQEKKSRIRNEKVPVKGGEFTVLSNSLVVLSTLNVAQVEGSFDTISKVLSTGAQGLDILNAQMVGDQAAIDKLNTLLIAFYSDSGNISVREFNHSDSTNRGVLTPVVIYSGSHRSKEAKSTALRGMNVDFLQDMVMEITVDLEEKGKTKYIQIRNIAGGNSETTLRLNISDVSYEAQLEQAEPAEQLPILT